MLLLYNKEDFLKKRFRMESFQAKQNAKTLIEQRFGIFNFVKKKLLTTLLVIARLLLAYYANLLGMGYLLV